jgi:hypothetical protein
MALTADDVTRLSALPGKGLETITIASAGTAQYSGRVIPPGRLLRISVEDSTGGHVQLVNEYLFGNRFGSDPDVDADELFDGIRHGQEGDLLSQYWTTNLTTSALSLDKNAEDSGRTHALEFPLADIDDVMDAWLVRGKRTRYGRGVKFDHARFKNSKALQLSMKKLETFIITAANNKVDVTASISGAYTATITAGVYTWTDLAAEIKTQLEAGSTSTFTISLVANVVRVAFTAEETHALDWATSTNPIGALLGYTADDVNGAGPFDADEAMNLDILEYSLREYRHSETNPIRSWDGSAWQNGATSWVDITGMSAGVLTDFTDSITTSSDSEAVIDTATAKSGDVGQNAASTASGYRAFISGPSTYRLFIRPKADVTDKNALIEDIGIYEAYAEADAYRIFEAVPLIVETTHWCRVSADTDNNSGKVYIQELGVS